MRYGVVVGLLAMCVSASAQTGWARYRVYVDSDNDAQKLTDSNLALFSEQVSLGSTDVVVGPNELPELWSLGLDHAFVSDLPAADAWKDQISISVDDYRYHYLRYADILTTYEGWRAANPSLVSRQQIGTTLGGRPIWAYKVSNPRGANAQQARIVVIGGIHAREWVSPAVTMYLFGNLVNKIVTDPIYANLMRRAAFYVVPVQNPDGYEYSWTDNRYWRKNRRNNGGGNYGVDLNRNFATGWGQPGSSGNAGSDTYRGPSAASELETQALRNFVNSMPHLDGFIDLHSYSQLIMWPWGYLQALCADDAAHRFVGVRMQNAIFAQSGRVYEEGPIYTTIYPASGTTVDYMYSPRRALSFTIELRDTGEFGFLLPEVQILPTQLENWEAFRSMLFDVTLRRTGGVRK